MTLVGILTLTGQYAIDLAGAQFVSGKGGMSAVFGRILSAPVVALPFYEVGPLLLPAGLLVLMVGLIKSQAVPPGAAAVTVAGT